MIVVTGTAASGLSHIEWIAQFIARIAVGLMFTLSGWGKVTEPARRDQMRDTVRQGGLPFPDVAAPLLSLVELVFGALLLVGLVTPLACLVLIGLMIGALATSVLPALHAKSIGDWVGKFLYLPEVLYIVILFWLLTAGPGRWSIDRVL